MAIFGYCRVSTNDQDLESQKNLISRFCIERKFSIDEWICVESSSRKSQRQRRIEELLEKLKGDDLVIASELSRLGRSIRETLDIIETIVGTKKARLILIKQNLDLNPIDRNNLTNKVLITVFSMVAELERDFISERTKEGLKARKAQGIQLGKPKGTIQKSKYDQDKEKIFHLIDLGVPLSTIIKTHLKYGNYLSLRTFIKKRRSPSIQLKETSC